MQSNTAVVKTRKQSTRENEYDQRSKQQRNQGNKHRQDRRDQRNSREEDSGRW